VPVSVPRTALHCWRDEDCFGVSGSQSPLKARQPRKNISVLASAPSLLTMATILGV
jgi:hypothetical protein